MRNVIVKIFAVLLTVWYSMSIIGFDVHTCSGSGRSFIATFIEGLACEDIHPEHSCHKASCCADHHECCSDHLHSDGLSFKAKSCCSNDYQVLDLTGILISNGHDHFDECSCGLCPCMALPSDGIQLPFYGNNLIAYITCPDSGAVSACERQAALRVWRI